MKLGRWNHNLTHIEWKPQDMWVGVFWKATVLTDEPDSRFECLDVWVCVIPMVPLHMQFHRACIRF